MASTNDLPQFLYIRFFTTAQQLLVKQGLFSFEASRSHSVTHAIIGRTPLDEWSARRRDLYLTTYNTHNRETSMPPTGSNSQSQQAGGRKPTLWCC